MNKPDKKLNDILCQKRSSGAGGKHKTKSEKFRSKYRNDWKSGVRD